MSKLILILSGWFLTTGTGIDDWLLPGGLVLWGAGMYLQLYLAVKRKVRKRRPVRTALDRNRLPAGIPPREIVVFIVYFRCKNESYLRISSHEGVLHFKRSGLRKMVLPD